MYQLLVEKLQSLYEGKNQASISFPSSEHTDIKKRLKKGLYVYTTRVSNEYNKYKINQIYKTPWNQSIKIVEIKKLTNIKQHPFYNELTKEQIQLLSKYNKIDFIKFKRHGGG